MREYTRYKSFLPKVERLMETDDLVYKLSNWITLTSLGVPEEVANKIEKLDVSYIYAKLINGKEMMSTKETFFRIKRFKCFKQSVDDLYFEPNMKVREIFSPNIDFEHPSGEVKEIHMDAIVEELNEMERIIREVNLNKLQSDVKKERMLKDILTNFRLLLKKMGMEEKKVGNVATLTKDGLTITINSDGIFSTDKDMITIATEDVEVKLK